MLKSALAWTAPSSICWTSSHYRLPDHGMIELAPNHKYGLSIEVPVMPASGAFGFGDAYGDLVDVSRLGAVVTNPVSLQPRRSAQGQRLAIHGDTFVVHTGWPNPGARRVIREHSATWERLTVPSSCICWPTVLPRSHRLPRSFDSPKCPWHRTGLYSRGLAQAASDSSPRPRWRVIFR